MSEAPIRDIVVNRKARHEFFLHDRFEAGISLLGSEVKSLRDGKAQLREAYIRMERGSAFLRGCHIAQYGPANRNNHDPVRPRQLLLNRAELNKLAKGTREKGMTIVPIRLYFKGSRVKLELALAKGKKLHDKRHTLKTRDAKKDMGRR